MVNRKPTPVQALLQEYVEKRGYSLADIAREVGVTKQAVHYLVAGKANGKPYMGFRGDDPLYNKVCKFLRIPEKIADHVAGEETAHYAAELRKRLEQKRKGIARPNAYSVNQASDLDKLAAVGI